MAYVVIDSELCKGCELCIDACNRGALSLSETQNSKGYLPTQLSKPEKCNGCTLCAIMCPDVAIAVYK
ncbi:MAG TPA: ferredoxin family protein [Symbiobacteriaceae bacterium]|nr:ferredoxin family protein [Symbiobacteriaceae bacterium]